MKVARPCADASARLGSALFSTCERRDSTLLAPMENPSASRLAKPRIRMMVVDSEAPTTPDTIASVVMTPSEAPKTRSGRYLPTIRCSLPAGARPSPSS